MCRMQVPAQHAPIPEDNDFIDENSISEPVQSTKRPLKIKFKSCYLYSEESVGINKKTRDADYILLLLLLSIRY